MKNKASFLLGLLLLFVATAVYGQGLHQMPKGASCFPRNCLSIPGLKLSEAQREAIQEIELTYSDQINGLQNRLLSKRIELRAVFANPTADEEAIRAKALEVFQLDSQCRQMVLGYQLAIRAQLTPEQLRVWCASAESCLTKGWTGKP